MEKFRQDFWTRFRIELWRIGFGLMDFCFGLWRGEFGGMGAYFGIFEVSDWGCTVYRLQLRLEETFVWRKLRIH